MKLKTTIALLIASAVLLFVVPSAFAAEGDATLTIKNETNWDWTFWLTSQSPAGLTTQFSVHKGATVVVTVPEGKYDFNLVRADGDRKWMNSPLSLDPSGTATITIVDAKAPKVVTSGDPPPASKPTGTLTIKNQTNWDWTFWLTSQSPAGLTTQFSVHKGATVVVTVPADTYDYHLVRADGDRKWVNSPVTIEANGTATVTIVDAKAPKVVTSGDAPPASVPTATLTIKNQTNWDWTFWITSQSPAALNGAFSMHARKTTTVTGPAGNFDFHLVRADGERRWLNSPISLGAGATGEIAIVDAVQPKVTTQVFPAAGQ